MALTIKAPSGTPGLSDYAPGNRRVRIRDVTFDSSYTTGGLSLKPSDVGMRSILTATPNGLVRTGSTGATAAAVSYDYANQKLQAYVSNGVSPALLNEAPAATNLSTNTVRIVFVGF